MVAPISQRSSATGTAEAYAALRGLRDELLWRLGAGDREYRLGSGDRECLRCSGSLIACFGALAVGLHKGIDART